MIDTKRLDICWLGPENELITEAHAQLCVIRNCSRSSLSVWVGEGKQLAGGGGQQYNGAGPGADSTQGESIWSSIGRQKVKRRLLLIIHIL
jgi:hypothetical protein